MNDRQITGSEAAALYERLRQERRVCPETSPGQSQCLHEFELTWARVLIDLQARQIVDLNRRLRGEPRPPIDPLAPS